VHIANVDKDHILKIVTFTKSLRFSTVLTLKLVITFEVNDSTSNLFGNSNFVPYRSFQSFIPFLNFFLVWLTVLSLFTNEPELGAGINPGTAG
jgi:hypothetical protein